MVAWDFAEHEILFIINVNAYYDTTRSRVKVTTVKHLRLFYRKKLGKVFPQREHAGVI